MFMLKSDLPFYENPGGLKIPNGCDRAIDAHVHVFLFRFPGRLCQ